MHAQDLPDTPSRNLRVVLVGTQHPGNIGSAARAMKTMDLSELVLVAPERFPHAEADALAAGAGDVLAAALVMDSVEQAVSDCVQVFGCTARDRRIALPQHSPREAVAQLHRAAAHGPVALLFGCERTGLDNAELQRCHAAVHIPANPAYSSLNLAAAVQILCYEWRLQQLAVDAGGDDGGDPDREPPADHAQLEGFFGQLHDTLDAIDFHKGRTPEAAMHKLRRLFLRAGLDAREVRLLRGVLADAQRMARLAAQRG